MLVITTPIAPKHEHTYYNCIKNDKTCTIIPTYEEILGIRRASRLAGKKAVNYDEDANQFKGEGKIYHKQAPNYSFPNLIQAKSKELQEQLGDKEFRKEINSNNFLKYQQKDTFISTLREALNMYERDGDKKALTNFSRRKGLSRRNVDDIMKHRYSISKDLLYYEREASRIIVPVAPIKFRTKIVEYFHSTGCFHHQGIKRTTNTIREYFFWPKMEVLVTQIIGLCDSCIKSNAKRESNKGKISPRLVNSIFDEICCDLVGPLPVTDDENKYILTIMDRFSRYVVAVPLVTKDAEIVAQAIVTHWIYVYGPPKRILSDNGTEFTAAVFKLIMKTMNIKQSFCTIYHPEANGMIERFHRFLKQRLAIKADELDLDYWEDASWDIYLASIVYAYNATVHTITKFAPFKILYGKNVRITLGFPEAEFLQQLEYKDYEHYLVNFIRQLEMIRDRSFAYQYAHHTELDKKLNRNRKGFTFKIGDWVSRRLFRTGSKGKLYV